jgi:hypothetical protein
MGGRLVRLGVLVSAGLLMGSCSSTSNIIGDTLPVWAGGLPPGTPPRAGTPGYNAYLKSVGVDVPPNPPPQPAQTAPLPEPPPAPPRGPREPVDEPIH